jgi:hypothetical protein
MIEITHAILHAFDFDTGSKSLSDRELDLGERPTRSYVQRLCRKALTSAEARHGEFEEGSEFAVRLGDYFRNGDFVGMSQEVAVFFWEQLRLCEDVGPVDLLVADFAETDSLKERAQAAGTQVGDAFAEAADADDAAFEAEPQRHFGVMLLPRKQSFVHDLRDFGDEAVNELVRTDATLPNPTQKIDSYLVVDDGTMAISFADKERAVAGQDKQIIPELLLRCTTRPSTKEVIDTVTTIVEDVAEEYGITPALAVSEAKAYVAERAEMGEVVLPQEIGERVFEDAPQMRETYERKAREERLPEEVPVRRGAANRMTKNHRIRTDTGIEITFPSDLARKPELIEFEREEDGTMRITIKGIAHIENR